MKYPECFSLLMGFSRDNFLPTILSQEFMFKRELVLFLAGFPIFMIQRSFKILLNSSQKDGRISREKNY